MSKISNPIQLPDTFPMPGILAFSELQGTVFINSYDQGVTSQLAIISIRFGEDKLSRIVPTDSLKTVMSVIPDTSTAFSGSGENLEVDNISQANFKPMNPIYLPDDVKTGPIMSLTMDIDNNELYAGLGANIADGTGFSGFAVIDMATKKYKRNIDLSNQGFNDFLPNMGVKAIAVSRLRKIFTSSGLHLPDFNGNDVVFCINDIDDVSVDKIVMSDIDGNSVSYVGGLVVDNLTDMLHVTCTHLSDTDFSAMSVVRSFDLKNDYKLVASSEVFDGELTQLVIDVRKQVLYTVGSDPNPLSNGSGIVSLDLKNLSTLNSLSMPSGQRIDQIIHLGKSGRIGVMTDDGTEISPPGPKPIFYIVDAPEIP